MKKCLKNLNIHQTYGRPISIIDPVTAEEVKPTLFFDKDTNEVKGKILLEPQKPYFAFEIREDRKFRG